MLARVVTRFNAHVHAEPLYALLKPFDGRTVSVGGAVLCLGPVSHYLGRLARVLGDHALALDHLDNALAVSRVLAAPPLVVRTQAETAKVLLDRRAEGDAERCGGEGHPEHASSSPQDSGEHVVAEVVGSQRELSGRGACR